MPESFKSRVLRWKFNLFPAYRGTGARVTYIAADFREIRVKLPLTFRSRNAVGTIYGGSMYGAVDPMYMIMLMQLLGRFRKPGRKTLFATFQLDDDELNVIRDATAPGTPIDRTYNVDLVDAEGVVHASVQKVIYIKRK